MNGIIDIIEGDHDVFVVEKETTRLSDAIDNFKNSETAVLFNHNVNFIATSSFCFKSFIANYGEIG